MIALRKPKPTPYATAQAILTEAEKAFCRDFVASIRRPKPTEAAFWARVHEPVNRDRDSFDAWNC
jgi:hypothetical protein